MTESWMEELTKQERLDTVFMNFCRELSTLSHCVRNQVGSVITVNNRVVATGWNGSAPGMINCDNHFAPRIGQLLIENPLWSRDDVLQSDVFKAEHGEWSKREIHAEQNAILQAAKNGTTIAGGTIYVSLSPCIDCAKALLVAGVERVVYAKEYERDPAGLNFLKETSMKLELFNVPK